MGLLSLTTMGLFASLTALTTTLAFTTLVLVTAMLFMALALALTLTALYRFHTILLSTFIC